MGRDHQRSISRYLFRLELAAQRQIQFVRAGGDGIPSGQAHSTGCHCFLHRIPHLRNESWIHTGTDRDSDQNDRRCPVGEVGLPVKFDRLARQRPFRFLRQARQSHQRITLPLTNPSENKLGIALGGL